MDIIRIPSSFSSGLKLVASKTLLTQMDPPRSTSFQVTLFKLHTKCQKLRTKKKFIFLAHLILLALTFSHSRHPDVTKLFSSPKNQIPFGIPVDTVCSQTLIDILNDSPNSPLDHYMGALVAHSSYNSCSHLHGPCLVPSTPRKWMVKGAPSIILNHVPSRQKSLTMRKKSIPK